MSINCPICGQQGLHACMLQPFTFKLPTVGVAPLDVGGGVAPLDVGGGAAPLTVGVDETRVVDPTTGGEKGVKLARFDLIPAGPLWEMAEHFGKGARKYADRNWERGYKWSLSFGALCRHLFVWWLGEDFDNHKPDCAADCTTHTGSHHLIAVAWHAFALREFALRNLGTDDRPTNK